LRNLYFPLPYALANVYLPGKSDFLRAEADGIVDKNPEWRSDFPFTNPESDWKAVPYKPLGERSSS
jgi:hypothetical protein